MSIIDNMDKYIRFFKAYWDTVLLVSLLGIIGYFGLTIALPILTEADVTTQIQSETQAKIQTIVGSISE